MGQDPFIAQLMQREKDEYTLGAMLGNALLAGAIPFFTRWIGPLKGGSYD